MEKAVAIMNTHDLHWYVTKRYVKDSIEHKYDSKNSKMDVHIHNRSEGRTGHLALTLHLKRSRQAENN